MRKVLVAAGGTGGHIVPALAVAEKIKALDPAAEVFFVGVGKEIEHKLIPSAGYELFEIPFPPFRGRGLRGVISFFFSVPKAFRTARRLLKEKKIDAVIGFGGYPSFAPMIAAFFSGVPSVLHEQNVQVGLANRLLELFAGKVFAVTGAKGFFRQHRVVELPLPVRSVFRKISPMTLNPPLKLLVLGGSQGAVTVNNAVISLLPLLQEHGVNVIHQTGLLDFERVRDCYSSADFKGVEVFPFTNDIPEKLEKATFVISRAGAMSVAENTAAGRPAIYIPLAIAGAHQRENCIRVVEKGAALVVEQDENLQGNLRKVVEGLLLNPTKLNEMAIKARDESLVSGSPSEDRIAEAVLTLN